MERTCLTILVCCFVLTAIVPQVIAKDDLQEEPPGRDPALEQKIYDRLVAIETDAVSIFREATQAMDAGDLEAAKAGYERVLDLAPDFPDALRRLSYVELSLGNVEAALQRVRRALAVQDSPLNHAAMVSPLLATEESDNEKEALVHAWKAVEGLPDDDYANSALLYAGMVNEDMGAIRQASTTLVEIVPEFPFAHYVVGLLAANDGKWEQAERELLLAQELGMPAEEVQAVLDDGIASQARLYRWLRRGGYTLGGWLVGMGVLILVGMVLSRLTLTAVQRARPAAQFEVRRGERIVRTIYRIVILLTSAYFYVSIPFVIFIVVAAAAGTFYLFLAMGRIPIRIAAIVAIGTIYTLVAIVRSVFVRLKDRDPGRPLLREEAPDLYRLAEEVAARVDTRPVDAIYVTPAPEIGVAERGNLWQKLRGVAQRNLILGLGALSGMTNSQFKAILAHEYGHFSNRDTAGGNLAHQVRISIHRMAYGLAINGLARWYNPAWLFVSGFNRVFLRITLGASRLQEILADRYAALAYGVQNSIDGLTHSVRQSLIFNLQVSQEVRQAVERQRSLQNLYLLPPIQSDSLQEELEAKVDEAMTRPTSPYDSHPAVQERIRLLEQLEVVGEVGESPESVWSLLPNAQELQTEMTDIVQASVERRQQLAA